MEVDLFDGAISGILCVQTMAQGMGGGGSLGGALEGPSCAESADILFV